MELEYTWGWDYPAYFKVYLTSWLMPPTSVYTPLVCVFSCDSSSYTIPLRYLTSACTFNPGAYFLNHPPSGVLLLVCICFLMCIFASLYVFAPLCVSASSCIFTSLCVSVSLYGSTSSYIFTSLCVSCRYMCVLYVQKN